MEWRKLCLRLQGMRIGAGVSLARVTTLWPHQVRIGDGAVVMDGAVFDFCHGRVLPGPSICVGARTYLGRGVEFNVRRGVALGEDCLVAAGCRFIDHDHGTETGTRMSLQEGSEAEISIGDDVWLGANVVVLKGVRIGTGAIVAAGAVVTRSIPDREIWGGVPARKLSERVPHRNGTPLATSQAGGGVAQREGRAE